MPGSIATRALLRFGGSGWILDPVRHATLAALDKLEPLLQQLRSTPGLVEKKRGVFYRRGRAFLHFHEDPSGLHADVRLDEDFERFRVETEEEREALLQMIWSGAAQT